LKIGILILALLLASINGSRADTITLNAAESGFYLQDASHNAGNYAVGWYTGSIPDNVEVRDYFIFDLAPVSGTVVSAFLRLSTAPPGSIVYGSSDPSETYTLFDVSTDLGPLTDGSAGLAAFDDLGTGVSYGGVTVTPALGATVDVPLNAAGIAFIASNHGRIAIGGAITTLAKGNTSEFLFNSTSALLTRQLVIITSAPSRQGLWWNAPPGSEAGWGINFAHQGDTIFATWFTYDASGKPLWLAVQADKTGPGVYAGNLFTTTGPPFDAVPFDPAVVAENTVGTAVLTFADDNNATFAYTVDIGSPAKSVVAQTKSITRQQFGTLPTCVWGAHRI
jgi:hypothetical protein